MVEDGVEVDDGEIVGGGGGGTRVWKENKGVEEEERE